MPTLHSPFSLTLPAAHASILLLYASASDRPLRWPLTLGALEPSAANHCTGRSQHLPALCICHCPVHRPLSKSARYENRLCLEHESSLHLDAYSALAFLFDSARCTCIYPAALCLSFRSAAALATDLGGLGAKRCQSLHRPLSAFACALYLPLPSAQVAL